MNKGYVIPGLLILSLLLGIFIDDERFHEFTEVLTYFYMVMMTLMFFCWIYFKLDRFVTKEDIAKLKLGDITQISENARSLRFIAIILMTFCQFWLLVLLIALIDFMSYWIQDDVEQILIKSDGGW